MNFQHSIRSTLSILAKCNSRYNKQSFNLIGILPGVQQTRNTHVVKHYKPQELLDWKPDSYEDPQKWHTRSDPRFIYESVVNKAMQKEANIKVLLLSTVSGLGNRGEVVSVPPTKARRNLLLPKLAVYASPENLEKYKDLRLASNEDQPSSYHVNKTINHLGGVLLWVSMNLEEKWVLEPWHLRVAFRKAGIICPDEAIELPSTPIKGPNMEMQHKGFYVTVTINQKEKVRVRCLINHVTADLRKKLHHVQVDTNEPLDPLLPEQAAYLYALHNQRKPLSPSNREPQITPEMVANSSPPEETN